ncbi:MAG TPA: hypothetical protein VKB59_08520 [Micromonosporaceae bacterium]|nr:hypothetical protein [Micromonosporaceae bacterium]
MLFELRLREGIHDGTITVAYRRWRRTQVVAGGHYRTGLDMVEVVSVRIVDPARITTVDARRAGYPDATAARAAIRESDDASVFRVEFRRLDVPDPRDTLAAADELTEVDIAEIDHRLDRLDHASRRGPWTASTLAAIAERPGIAAPILAASFGLETIVFKRSVRSLKALGLTHSLRVGYRLAPRGAAYLAATSRAAAGRPTAAGRDGAAATKTDEHR